MGRHPWLLPALARQRMTFSLAFAIVQWGIVLPVQVYFVIRSWRNWKESDKELQEAVRYRHEALTCYLEAMHDVGLEPGAEEKPPTVQ
jgi:hypothetical protein